MLLRQLRVHIVNPKGHGRFSFYTFGFFTLRCLKATTCKTFWTNSFCEMMTNFPLVTWHWKLVRITYKLQIISMEICQNNIKRGSPDDLIPFAGISCILRRLFLRVSPWFLRSSVTRKWHIQYLSQTGQFPIDSSSQSKQTRKSI